MLFTKLYKQHIVQLVFFCSQELVVRISRFTPLILTSLTGDHSELICSLFTFSCPSRNPIKSFHCFFIPHIPKKLFFFNFTRNASSFPVLKSPSPPDPLFWCCLSMSLLTQKVATIATLAYKTAKKVVKITTHSKV